MPQATGECFKEAFSKSSLPLMSKRLLAHGVANVTLLHVAPHNCLGLAREYKKSNEDEGAGSGTQASGGPW